MTDTVRQHREEALKRAVMAGDETEWRAWYDETFDAIQRFVHWRLRGKSNCGEEILQETWLIAVKRIRDFEPQKGAFLDWVRGIAMNVIRNHLRRNPSISVLPLTDEIAQQSDSTTVNRAFQLERIMAVLQFLPGKYADVLKQKYLEQKTVLEIAISWNESTKTVESLLTRARQAVREALGTDQPK